MGNIITIGDDGGDDDALRDEDEAVMGLQPTAPGNNHNHFPAPSAAVSAVGEWAPGTPTRQSSWSVAPPSDVWNTGYSTGESPGKWPSFPEQVPSSGVSQQPSSTWPTTGASQDPWAELPLHHAAATGAPSAELNRLVAHEGEDVDAQDRSGSTPLHLACYFGHEHCALWLMNRGRARFILDADGNTPADVARQNGHVKLAEALEQRMGDAVKANRWRRGLASAGQDRREEQLFVEVSRLQSENARLRASEKRARAELEAEVAERIKLFRRVVGAQQQTTAHHQDSSFDLNEIVADLRLQAASFKAQRDALHAELRLIEETLSDLEILLGAAQPDASANKIADTVLADEFVSPSARLKSCLRRI